MSTTNRIRLQAVTKTRRPTLPIHDRKLKTGLQLRRQQTTRINTSTSRRRVLKPSQPINITHMFKLLLSSHKVQVTRLHNRTLRHHRLLQHTPRSPSQPPPPLLTRSNTSLRPTRIRHRQYTDNLHPLTQLRQHSRQSHRHNHTPHSSSHHHRHRRTAPPLICNLFDRTLLRPVLRSRIHNTHTTTVNSYGPEPAASAAREERIANQAKGGNTNQKKPKPNAVTQ